MSLVKTTQSQRRSDGSSMKAVVQLTNNVCFADSQLSINQLTHVSHGPLGTSLAILLSADLLIGNS